MSWNKSSNYNNMHGATIYISSIVLQVHYIFQSETLIRYINKNAPMRKMCSKYVSRKGALFSQFSCTKIPYNDGPCMTKTQNFVTVIV